MMTKTKRPTKDRYFMNMAVDAAARATCDRKHVGAVIVSPEGDLLGSGYNGSIRKAAHCDDVGHQMEDGHCVRTVHAEANAIAQAAKNRGGTNGATLYTTASPCWQCFKLLANAGIKRIVFGEIYRDSSITRYAAEAGIELSHESPVPQRPSKADPGELDSPSDSGFDPSEPRKSVPPG